MCVCVEVFFFAPFFDVCINIHRPVSLIYRIIAVFRAHFLMDTFWLLGAFCYEEEEEEEKSLSRKEEEEEKAMQEQSRETSSSSPKDRGGLLKRNLLPPAANRINLVIIIIIRHFFIYIYIYCIYISLSLLFFFWKETFDVWWLCAVSFLIKKRKKKTPFGVRFMTFEFKLFFYFLISLCERWAENTAHPSVNVWISTERSTHINYWIVYSRSGTSNLFRYDVI